MKLAFLDTETTGLNPETAAVLELAIIRRDEETGAESRWYTLIRPTEEEISHAEAKALEINKFSWERWKNAPTMEEMGQQILDLLDGHVLVGHNIGFDEQMLNATLRRHGFNKSVPFTKIDTQTLVMEHLFPLGLKYKGMDKVRKYLGWSMVGAHTAMKDTEDCMHLFDMLWRLSPIDRLILKLRIKLGLTAVS